MSTWPIGGIIVKFSVFCIIVYHCVSLCVIEYYCVLLCFIVYTIREDNLIGERPDSSKLPV